MIDTQIPGSASDLRRAADYLRDALGEETTRLADESVRQRRQLQDVWEGHAGAAFRERTSTLATAADEVARVNRTLARELDALADALEEAEEGLAQVRRRARRLGLQVDGYLIREPLPFPTQPGETHTTAFQHWLELHDEYRECRALALRWVGLWTRATQRLEAQVESNLATLVQATTALLVTGYSAWLLHRLGGVLAGQSAFLWDEAARFNARADELTQQLRDGTLPADPRHLGEIDDFRSRAAQAEEAAEAIPTKAKLPLKVSAGLEVFNLAATGYGVYADIQSGESAGQAVASQGGGLLAGIGAGSAAAVVLGSNIVPVVGPVVTFGAVATAGIAASIWADRAIDRALESRKGPQETERQAREERRIARVLEDR